MLRTSSTRFTAVAFATILATGALMASVHWALPGDEDPEPPISTGHDAPGLAGNPIAMPALFEENHGQFAGDIHYVAQSAEGTALFREDAVLFASRDANETQPPITMQFDGADAVAPSGQNPLRTKVNYLRAPQDGGAIQGVPTFNGVRYADLYEGTDLVFYVNLEGRIQFDFVLAPGADPNRIALSFDDTAAVTLDRGDLHVSHAGFSIRQGAPHIYQQKDGKQLTVDGAFAMRSPSTVGFDVGSFDPDLPLIIDPVVAYATLIGSGGTDTVYDVAVDPATGDYVVVGQAAANTLTGFSGVPKPTYGSGSGQRAFIIRFDAMQDEPQWVTYIGGSGTVALTKVRVEGDRILAGGSASGSWPQGSTIGGRHCLSGTGGTGALVVLRHDASVIASCKVGPAGSSVRITDLGRDASGDLLIVGDGVPNYGGGNWAANDAYQKAAMGGTEGFVMKYLWNSPQYDGQYPNTYMEATYWSFFGGSGDDFVEGVTTDGSGNVVIAGTTNSDGSLDRPVALPLRDPQQGAFGGGSSDAFFARFDLGQSGDASLLDSTFFGGSGADRATALEWSDGSAYAVGITDSPDLPLPATPTPFQGASAGGQDMFIAGLDPAQSGASQLTFATYLGGAGDDEANDVDANNAGHLLVSGTTGSSDLPAPGKSPQTTHGGGTDAYLALVDPAKSGGDQLAWATFQGSSGNDAGYGAAVSPDGEKLLLAGRTVGPFSTTWDAVEDTVAGTDGFLVRFTKGPVVRIDATAQAFHLETVSLQDLSTQGDAPLTSRTWTFTDGGSAVGTSVEHAFEGKGPHVITLTVKDQNGRTAQRQQDILILNNPPTGQEDTFFTAKETDLVILIDDMLANDGDLDDDPFTFDRIETIPDITQGTMIDNGGDPHTYTYKPPTGYEGTDEFTYYIHDGEDESQPIPIHIQVGNTNNAPTAADDYPDPISSGATVPINVLANDNDPDADTLQIQAWDATSTNGGTITKDDQGTGDPTDDTLLYTAPSTAGGDTFTYTINDGKGKTDTATVYLTITVPNEPPIAVADPDRSTEEDVAVVIDVLANDNDPDNGPQPLAIDAHDATSAQGGTITEVLGGLRYTPPNEYSGPDSFTYTITDGEDTNGPATVSINVAAVNDAPAANDDELGNAEQATATTFDWASLLANDNDIDGPTLTISSFDTTTTGSGTINDEGDGTFTYTSSPSHVGTDTFTYTITDGTLTDTATATINVIVAGNDPPNANNDHLQTDEDTTLTFTEADLLANDNDPNGDTLQFTWITPPGTGFTQTDTTYTYTPPTDWSGTETLTYRLTDGKGGQDTATLTIQIQPVNDPPVPTPDGPYGIQNGKTLQVPAETGLLANDLDPEDDPLSASLVTGPTQGELQVNPDGSFTYTPNPDATGTDSFTYQVTDGTDAATATVQISIEASLNAGYQRPYRTGASQTPEHKTPPQAPRANAGEPQTVPEGAPVYLDGTGSTGDELQYTWTQITGPNIELAASDTSHPYFIAPTINTIQPATLTFRLVTTNNIGSSSNHVTITVHSTNQAPRPILNGPTTAMAGDTVTLDASQTHDPDGDQITLTWRQTKGPGIRWAQQGDTITFQAPPVHEPTILAFRLTASDQATIVPIDTEILVTPQPTPPTPEPTTPDIIMAQQANGVRLSADIPSDATWHLGDGTTATGDTITHQYQPGTYNITVQWKDANGQHNLTQALTIQGPQATPAPATPATFPWTILIAATIAILAIATLTTTLLRRR